MSEQDVKEIEIAYYRMIVDGKEMARLTPQQYKTRRHLGKYKGIRFVPITAKEAMVGDLR